MAIYIWVTKSNIPPAVLVSMPVGNKVEELDKCLTKAIREMDSSIKKVDQGFSEIRKLDIYKKADDGLVVNKEKQLLELLA